MKINISSDHFLIKKSEFNDLFKIMKICFFLLFVFVFQMMATNIEAQDAVINLESNTVNVRMLISEIEKQTDYLVVYSNREVNTSREVTLKKKSDKVSEYLHQTFNGTDIGYEFENNYIVLSRKAQETASILTGLTQTAQQLGKTVKGSVTDSNGEPIIGATIVLKGDATRGTVTDIDGNYSIPNIKDNDVLQITYVGMKAQEVNTSGRSTINVIMEADIELLDEVVVVGYGTMKKSDLTGAIATIDGDKLAQRNATQLSTALQGAIPGLMVTRSNSEPGATANIKIRGITTIGDSDPLVIVDGVPGDINMIHSKDIESITVLKDAASASIYGSRAAAGVIVISTKRAKSNVLSLNYDFNYGMEIPTSQPKNVGIQRYLEMANELRYNDNPNGGEYQEYTQEQVNNWVDMNLTDPDTYPITDWRELLIRNYAPRQSHTLSLSGGNNFVKTRASLNYDDIDGLLTVNNINYKRYIATVNNDFTFNKYLNASFDFNVKRTESYEPSQTNIWYMIRAYSPAYAWKWSHGGLADVKGGNNPYGRVKEGGSNQGWFTKLGGRLAINFTPIEGLKFSAVASPNYSISKTKIFNLQAGYTGSDNPSNVIGYFQDHTSTSLSERRYDNNDLTTQFLLTYDKKLKRHGLNFLAGNENYSYFYENLSASRDLYELKEFPYLSIGPRTLIDNGGNAHEIAYRSFFGRFAYSYANKYLFQANYRYDGSSRFHRDFRWGGFPSISLGWVLSEENFIKNINFENLSFLKLRASYGTLGNERIGNYPYQALIDFTHSLFYDNPSSTDATYHNGAAQIQYAIKDLSWETTKSYDIGLDAVFFNNKMSITADYYRKETNDMLLDLKIPGYVGFANPQQNTGKMFTKGFDFEATWRDEIGDFRYSISANLSDFVSEMGDLGGTQFIGNKVKFEGSEFNEWYGYLSDGLFLSQEDIDNSATLNSNVTVGDVKFLDISGPDGEPDGLISSEYDRVLLGGSLPRFMFGGTITGGYKDFDISMAFQGVGKQNVRITSGMATAMPGNWGHIPAILDNDYWSSFNTEEENAKARYPRLTYVNGSSNLYMSDFWMFNGRYFRMKNLTVGYTLPVTLTQKVNISRLRFYISGNDLFCLSKYPTGWDPERGDSSYPITSSLLFGININF